MKRDAERAPGREGVPALAPLAWLYRGGVAVARRRRAPNLDAGTRPRVIAVGNLEVGGSGKTPLAMRLMEDFRRAGRRAGYASRGYGSRSERAPGVTLVVSDAGTEAASPGARVVSRAHPDLAREIGDEGAIVAGRLTDAPLAFSRDRNAAVAVLATAGVDVVVVDDAFQTWDLRRHLDVVLLDAARPFGNGRLLPAGRLREPPSALGRADVVVFNGVSSESDVERLRHAVSPWLKPSARVGGLVRRVRLEAASGDAGEPARRAVLVSGIARPAAFETDVAALGVESATHLVFGDHHHHGAEDVAAIADACRRAHCSAVVVTEKDWVKLRALPPLDEAVFVARLDVSWAGEAPALD